MTVKTAERKVAVDSKLVGEIAPHINELAGKLVANGTVGKDGVVLFNKGTYEEILPETLTIKNVEEVFKHHADLVSATTLATAELAEMAMKKDKKLDQVSSELRVEGKGMRAVGAINSRYVREQERTVRNPSKPEEPARQVTTYGATTSHITTFSTRNRGELKTVKAVVSARAEKLFK